MTGGKVGKKGLEGKYVFLVLVPLYPFDLVQAHAFARRLVL